MVIALRVLEAVVLPVLLLAAAGLVARATRRTRCPRCGRQHPAHAHPADRTDTTEGEPW